MICLRKSQHATVSLTVKITIPDKQFSSKMQEENYSKPVFLIKMMP